MVGHRGHDNVCLVLHLFLTELVTKMKPNVNSVEVHPQLSINRQPTYGALAGWWVVLVHSGPIIALSLLGKVHPPGQAK